MIEGLIRFTASSRCTQKCSFLTAAHPIMNATSPREPMLPSWMWDCRPTKHKRESYLAKLGFVREG